MGQHHQMADFQHSHISLCHPVPESDPYSPTARQPGYSGVKAQSAFLSATQLPTSNLHCFASRLRVLRGMRFDGLLGRVPADRKNGWGKTPTRAKGRSQHLRYRISGGLSSFFRVKAQPAKAVARLVPCLPARGVTLRRIEVQALSRRPPPAEHLNYRPDSFCLSLVRKHDRMRSPFVWIFFFCILNKRIT